MGSVPPVDGGTVLLLFRSTLSLSLLSASGHSSGFGEIGRFRVVGGVMTSRFCEHMGPGLWKLQSGSCLDIWKGLRISRLSSSNSLTFLADFLPDTQYVFINPFPCTQEDKHNMKPDKYLTLASIPFQFGMCNSLTGFIQLCCFRTRVEYQVSGKGLSVKHFRNSA